ncbi:hypothetical protein P3T76_007504 [Phytophthora citrophthora]|uniref:Uncharacterized protein n=1 Tax=Phytophthora citrophthora TaxID=4793 RepID=A0AAD9GM78_9STRA|nr:hypothetical protein P3T76_007504 [Phytophthora citrophthora]
MSHANIHGEGNHTFLKLKDVLQEERLYHATSSLLHDWENGPLQAGVTSSPDRPYTVHLRAPCDWGFQIVTEPEGSTLYTVDQRQDSITTRLMTPISSSVDFTRLTHRYAYTARWNSCLEWR